MEVFPENSGKTFFGFETGSDVLNLQPKTFSSTLTNIASGIGIVASYGIEIVTTANAMGVYLHSIRLRMLGSRPSP